MVVKGLCISDIHFGLPCTERIYQELSQLKDFINNNELDVIHINGDYFDRKLVFCEPASIIAMQFFYELRELCIKKKIKLRIIHGTEGHERMQTEMFRTLKSKYLDMKIFNTVTEEELFPGFNVLYIPEEYPVDSEEYYKEYKNKEYQALMGHGMWDFAAAAQSVIDEADRKDTKTAPVFKYSEWEKTIPHGMAIFGHIHLRMVHKKKVFYPGSFTAWDFTDISKKGFAYYTYNTEKGVYNVRLIDNNQIPIFKTQSILNLGLDLNNCEIDDIQRAIEPLAENADYFRLDVSGLPLDKLEIVKRMFKDDRKITVKIIDKKRPIINQSDKDRYMRYEYLLREKLPIDETILKFIQDDLSDKPGAKDITLEMVSNIIKEEVN